jgi:hypothetical protein
MLVLDKHSSLISWNANDEEKKLYNIYYRILALQLPEITKEHSYGGTFDTSLNSLMVYTTCLVVSVRHFSSHSKTISCQSERIDPAYLRCLGRLLIDTAQLLSFANVPITRTLVEVESFLQNYMT